MDEEILREIFDEMIGESRRTDERLTPFTLKAMEINRRNQIVWTPVGVRQTASPARSHRENSCERTYRDRRNTIN